MAVIAPPGMIAHHFTVDVEEYFQVSAFAGVVPRSVWGDFESRVVGSVRRLLELLAQHQARGTFFVLGWVAARHPDLIRAIAAEGHEIASHGWDHARVTEQALPDFRESVRRTKRALEDLVGAAVTGFRAPSFSILPGMEWALDVLLQEGYRYDSSLFPVRRPGYGYANGRRDPHVIARPVGRLVEVPPATLRVCGVNLPAGGGAYFRLAPALVRAALRAAGRRGVPATFYIHPWEIDSTQPRLAVPALVRFRHYTGIQRCLTRLTDLLRRFRFAPVVETVDALERSTTARGPRFAGSWTRLEQEYTL